MDVNKILNSIKSMLIAFVYPTRAFKRFLLRFVIKALKLLSTEREKTATGVFDYYFTKIKNAKEREETTVLKPALNNVGSLVGLADAAKSGVSLVMGFFYFFVLFFADSYIFMKIYQGAQFTGKMPKFWVMVLLIVTVYYLGLFLFHQLKKIKDFETSFIKDYILVDFSYIYAKAIEIDKEVAEIAMNAIIETTLLKSDNTYQKAKTDLKRKLGVK